MARDFVTGLPTTPSNTRPAAPSNLVPVYAMVGIVSPGFEQSNGRSITPGGAYPMTPALRGTDTQVYQMVAGLSQGQGYGPGDALVPVPSHFL